ncbi:hypothetical protein [Tautonia marina]|uniref:hypothetical protein n=1 Tax=Tautonia marina TaxID=2653855 RepID=UPI0012604DB4|nr:hypothetical protein [Tautonia marina]
MHTVAPIWRVAALMIPLASLAGCDWLPVRRRIDPALYPVPARPDPALIRGHRKLSPASTETTPHPTSLAGGPIDRPLPLLPDLVPVSPDELFGPPAATPMLDAALVRAQAIETAVFDDGTSSSTGVEPTSSARDETLPEEFLQESTEIDPSQSIEPGDTLPSAMPASVEVPPIPNEVPDPLDATETTDPGLDRDSLHDSIGIEPTSAVETPEIRSEEQEGSSLERLLEETQAQLTREEQNAESPTSDEQLLKQIAMGEFQGKINDSNLWQTVMQLLADSEPETDTMTGTFPEASVSLLRVGRIAFCREVLGFDRIKPFDSETLQAGQKILVYAEVEGVHYLPEDGGQVSRLSTTLEILDDGESPLRWSNVVPVEDRCSRPRHDYFVAYRLALPESLAPGRYRLRVSQHDLLSGQEDAAETSFVIVSDGG